MGRDYTEFTETGEGERTISPRQLLPEGPNGPNSGEALTGKAQGAASPCQQPSGRAQKLLPAPEEPPSPFTALPGALSPAPSPNRPPQPLLPSRPPQPPPLTAPCRCRMRSAGAAPPPRLRHAAATSPPAGRGGGSRGVRGWGGVRSARGDTGLRERCANGGKLLVPHRVMLGVQRQDQPRIWASSEVI